MARKPLILLIEDQPDSQQIIQAILGSEIELVCAVNLTEGGIKLRERNFDLLLLDGNLPDGDGFEFFAKLKREPEFKNLPVVFLTGRHQINDRVAAFAMGAEDYIVKPVEPREFRARVEAKLKKFSNQEGDVAIVRGSLKVDPDRFRAFKTDTDGKERELSLTPHEFKLLMAFVKNEDVVLTRDQLINAGWGDSVHVLERTVDRHVSGLKKKLGSGVEQIQPVYGVGYRFTRIVKSKGKQAA